MKLRISLRNIMRYTVPMCGVFFYGCATLSEKDCHLGRWYDIGFRDGSRGYSISRLADHRDACIEYAIEPNQEIWKQGWMEGLQHYCRAENAYEVGRTGEHFNMAVCSNQNELEVAYQDGLRIYETALEISELKQERAELVKNAKETLQSRQFESDRELLLYREQLYFRLRQIDRELRLLRWDQLLTD
ncbi:DUF2799 domain-containing protein [Cardiobacteriaceae bacterium TAE3-ERU3]|nr:DUF2799 domain-containing protein [Cardiobacteriaceae bacterium TAE3-ERU3]